MLHKEKMSFYKKGIPEEEAPGEGSKIIAIEGSSFNSRIPAAIQE